MRGLVLATLTALALAGATPALAQDAKHPTPAGGHVKSTEEIIHDLSVRGVLLSTSEPQAGAQMPAVGLDIKFKVNSAELTDQAKEQIRQLAEAIKSDQLAEYRFQVEGHTDSTGRADRNMVLSQQRAEAVKDHLAAAYGIPRGRLEAVGRGQTMPINAADPANPANRRVQVVNLGQ
jgi:outer membrane protein OmpA-like peptidoglycan-associated protein